MKSFLRAVIVDDEAPARERLATLLAAHPRVEIVGEAADIDAAVAVCERVRPDVIFLDVQLRREDGFELLPRLKKVPDVIFVTAHDQHAVRAFEVNALDYLLKPIDPDRLAAALARLNAPHDPPPSAAPDVERWKRIENIYEGARDRPLAERSAFLERSCSGDVELREEIESLLQADDDAGAFLSSDELKEHIVELDPEGALSLVGSTVGRYSIESEIGAGAMGTVYLACDTSLDRKVALKLLPAHYTQDPERTSRFVREAKAASGLNHPNILTIHEIGQTGETWFIATEFVEGVTLRQKLESGVISIEETLDIAAQCMGALETAHRAGIIHRDIKPENIMIRLDGVVKVIDFGLALVAAPSKEIRAGGTEPGKVIGTPRYMSPEQARGDKLDGRSDIFSVGAVLYEMLEGRPAFAGATAAEVFANLLGSGSDSDPAIRRAKAYPALERIVSRALKKQPDARYQAMNEFAADVKTLRQQLHTGRARVKPRRWVLAAVAVLLLVAMASGEVRSRISNWFYPPTVQSLAVLPMLNLSGDPQQEYLVDGMTDNLITEIARETSLRVISRTSVMQYKGVSKPLPEIAQALNVDGVIEGSVRKSDGRLAITVQLLDARKDRHLWARNYERGEGELLSLLAEIAQDVRHQLSASTVAPVSVAQSVDSQAYDFYLRGRFAWNKRTGDGYREALQYFNQAIEHDPKYARAYAGLADSYLLLGEYSIWPADDAYSRARAAASRALEFDPALGEAYASLGQTDANEWKWSDADREFQRAVELSSGYATGRQWRAEFLHRIGRVAEAIVEMKRAQQLDPLSPIINTQLGWILASGRRYDEAITQLKRTIEIAPHFAPAHADLGIAYDLNGQHDEALKALQTAQEIDNTPDRAVWVARQYALSGRPALAREAIQPLLPLAAEARVNPATLALVYIALGDHEEAFKWMQIGCRVHLLPPLKAYPPYDPIRSDPRFADLIRCMGLEP